MNTDGREELEKRILIADGDLADDGPVAGVADHAHTLLLQQMRTWKKLRDNYQGLRVVTTRVLMIDGIRMNVQFNPGRIISTAAKTDAASIRERKCFLCAANLPPEQRGFLFRDMYVVLCNPFPILPEHFTVPHVRHTDQAIMPTLPAMLELARAMEGRYTVFYNGPRCGASAPDHLHLQAGTRGVMPLEDEYRQLQKEAGSVLLNDAQLRVITVDRRPRPFIGIEAGNPAAVTGAFERLLAAYAGQSVPGEEPMINLLCWFERGRWILVVLPRLKHRPACYFAEGSEKIVVSPAAVDIGGVFTTPLEADYVRMNETLLRQILDEVMLPEERFRELSGEYRALLETM